MEFAFSTKNIASIIVFVSALLDLVLGVWVILNTQNRKVTRIFALLCATVALFSFSSVFLNLSEASFAKTYWFFSYVLCLLFTPIILYHQILQSLSHPGRDERGVPVSWIPGRVKQLAYAFGVGLCLLAFRGDLFFLGNNNRFVVPILAKGFEGLVTLYGILVLGGLILLIKFAWMATDRGQRNRLFSVGALSTILGILFSSCLVVPFYLFSIWIFPTLVCSMTISLLLMAMPVTSTRFYQIANILRQALSHLLTALVICLTFTIMQLIVNRIFKGEGISYIEVLALCIGSIVTAFLVLPKRFYIEKFTDRLLFYDRYEQAKRIEELSKKISLCQDKEGLLTTLFEALSKSEIGFMVGCLILKASKKPFFRIVREWGLPPDVKGSPLREDHVLIQYLKIEKREILVDTLINRVMTDWDRQILKESMASIKAEICFPIFRNQDHMLIGLIALGDARLGPSSYVGRNLFWLMNLMERAASMLVNFITQEQNNALIPYAGKSVAEEVFRSKEDFHEDEVGERAWVSVMVVDIRHFTSLCNRLNPQTVVKLLKEFRSLVTRIVEDHGGDVDKYIGDAVMVSFGLPISKDKTEPDKKAVTCAPKILAEIEKINNQNGWVHGQKISVGIGIASGDVIAGHVDSGTRTEYTVIGDAANMVARLEDIAQENQVLLSPATYERVKDQVQIRAWPPQQLDGFDKPVIIYELKVYSDGEFWKQAANG